MRALAIAAAVVQFVDIGSRLLVEQWHKYRDRDGKSEARKAAAKLVGEVTALTELLHEASDRLGLDAARFSHRQFIAIRQRCDVLSESFRRALRNIEAEGPQPLDSPE